MGDAGLTGRKIIVDTYGGYSRHGGGALSGKDPTKVDRSACYMARYVAKNLVAAGVARKVEVQLAYAIGVAEPVSVMVDTFGTGVIPDAQITELDSREFLAHARGHHRSSRSPAADLLARRLPIGHFGRNEPGFTWERTDKARQDPQRSWLRAAQWLSRAANSLRDYNSNASTNSGEKLRGNSSETCR